MPYLYALIWGLGVASAAFAPAMSLILCGHAGAFASRRARIDRQGLVYEMDGQVGIWLPEEMAYLGNATLLEQSGRDRDEILAEGVRRRNRRSWFRNR